MVLMSNIRKDSLLFKKKVGSSCGSVLMVSLSSGLNDIRKDLRKDSLLLEKKEGFLWTGKNYFWK